jgi:hypothetical protein
MADGIRSKTNPKSGADSTALDAEQCSNAAWVRQQSGAAYANAKQIQATSAISSYQQLSAAAPSLVVPSFPFVL